jgi:hypothetical protein
MLTGDVLHNIGGLDTVFSVLCVRAYTHTHVYVYIYIVYSLTVYVL